MAVAVGTGHRIGGRADLRFLTVLLADLPRRRRNFRIDRISSAFKRGVFKCTNYWLLRFF
jgi:hypothetical protein